MTDITVTTLSAGPCSRINCENGGTCYYDVISGQAYCQCQGEFTGRHCEGKKDTLLW